MTDNNEFVDKVLHDTVVRSVKKQFREEVEHHRYMSKVLAEILAIHGLASCVVTVKPHGTYLCLNVERMTREQFDAVHEVLSSSPPPMDKETAELIAFEGMAEENGDISEDDQPE